MAKEKSRMQAALLHDKGVDFARIKQKKKAKLRNKAKKKIATVETEDDELSNAEAEEKKGLGDGEDEDDNEEKEDEDEDEQVIGDAIVSIPEDGDSLFDSSIDGTESDEDEDEDEEEINMEDIEDQLEEDEDIIPRERVTINYTKALLASLKRIAIDTSAAAPFASHMVICEAADEPTENKIPDIMDDVQREAQFLTQALRAARLGRKRLIKEGVPFSRPNDYFAEMLRPETVMDKVKAKLVEDATQKKAAAEARKQRDLKKFGKQVQIAKMQERAKQKRETLNKIKELKKKRSENPSSAAGAGTTEAADVDFDVAVDEELSIYDKNKDHRGGGRKSSAPGVAGAPSAKRQKRDVKFGFGGKKRHAKSGDAFSSGDLSGFSHKKMKGRTGGGAATRPGKNRRKAMAGRR